MYGADIFRCLLDASRRVGADGILVGTTAASDLVNDAMKNLFFGNDSVAVLRIPRVVSLCVFGRWLAARQRGSEAARQRGSEAAKAKERYNGIVNKYAVFRAHDAAE